MPLIRTKLLPATQTKGTRIKAYYQGGSIMIGYSYTGETELESNHRRAALAMLDKLGLSWFDLYIETNRLNNREFVHTWNNEEAEFLRPQA